MKKALGQLGETARQQVPQDGVDLVGGDQREEVGGAVQREEAAESLAGHEEAGCRGHRTPISLAKRWLRQSGLGDKRKKNLTRIADPFAAFPPRFQTGGG